MFEKRGILTLWLFKDKNKGAGEVVQGLGMQTTLQRTRVLVPVQFYSQAAHNRLCSSSRGSRTLFWPQYTLVHVHMYVETRVKLKIYILERQTKSPSGRWKDRELGTLWNTRTAYLVITGFEDGKKMPLVKEHKMTLKAWDSPQTAIKKMALLS